MYSLRYFTVGTRFYVREAFSTVARDPEPDTPGYVMYLGGELVPPGYFEQVLTVSRAETISVHLPIWISNRTLLVEFQSMFEEIADGIFEFEKLKCCED